MEDQYLGEAAIDVTVEPSRAVFLFPTGDRRAFRKALQEASSRWAGLLQPIVPISPTGRVQGGWRQMVETMDVTSAITVGCSTEASTAACAALELPWSTIERSDAGPARHTLHWSAVARHLDYTPVSARPDGALWEATLVGDPAQPTHGASLVTPRHGPTEDIAARAAARRQTVLEAGTVQLGEVMGSNGPFETPAVLWVTRRDSLSDSVWFWNLRALASRTFDPFPMLLVPEAFIKDWTDAEQMVTGLLARPVADGLDLVINSASVPAADLRRLASRLGLEPRREPSKQTRGMGERPLRQPPFRYAVNVELRPFLLFGRKYGYKGTARAQLFREKTRVPLGVCRVSEAVGESLFHIMPTRLAGSFITQLPPRPEVARLVEPNATWRDGELALLLGYHETGEINIANPDSDAVLLALRQALPISNSVSDKGMLGEALLRSGDATLLRSAKHVQLIRDLTTRRSKELLQELRRNANNADAVPLIEIAQAWGGRAERRYRSAKDLGGARVRPALEEMAALGWLERGLKCECRHCGISSFVALAETDGPSTCPGCKRAATYAASSGVDVHYRLNTLLDRSSDQGVIPHIMVELALAAVHKHTHLVLGMDLTTEDGVRVEADLFGFWGREVVSGEVKTTAADFTRAQVQRDVSLSSRLKADVHVMAATELIPDDTIELARRFADKRGLKLVVVHTVNGDMSVVRT